MKATIVSMVAASSLIFAGAAMAADMPAAAKTKCGGCHALDQKAMGPSFTEIAAKYKGDKDAVSKLTANINKGGAFGWKAKMPMPPKGMNANEAEIKTMAEFIAGLAK
ncbi:MAG: c-type cytochrome [Nitrosomonadales bacterium]|nr:c-type cytochrome [Nitrosomonadales bacterium]